MKINKNGEVILSANEWKVGNFIIKNEENHIKITTANAPTNLPLWGIRYRKDMVISSFILLCVEHLSNKGYSNRLHNWLSVMYNATSVVPDLEEKFLYDVMDASDKAFEKMKHLYNPTSITDEEDAKILEEEREKAEIAEDVDNIGTI